MIQLHQFPTGFGLPNLSPFCMKVETFLKLAELPYEICWQQGPRGAPLKKLPFIKDGDAVVADSHNILDYLTQRHGADLNRHLSTEQKAVSLAFERLLSDHLYWAMLYSRWVDEAGWAQYKPVLFGALPALLRSPVAGLVRKTQIKRTRGHGLGTLPSAEIYRQAGEDIDAIAGWLGDKTYFMGDTPSRVDASVYAFIGMSYELPLANPFKHLIAAHPNLVAYCGRMKQRCFPKT